MCIGYQIFDIDIWRGSSFFSKDILELTLCTTIVNYPSTQYNANGYNTVISGRECTLECWLGENFCWKM